MLQSEELVKALDRAREQVQAGIDLEPVLFSLREKGADKIDSIKIVRTVLNLSIAQAKSLVDRSETWSDRYADDHAFHEAVRQAAERLKTENTGTEVVIEERSSDPESDTNCEENKS